MKKKEICFRCWIDIDGIKFFGPGRAELLEGILETGSIAMAARRMGMSYKKAWDMIEDMNTRGRRPYVVARKGGKQGGGTELTVTGRKVLDSYKKLNHRFLAVTKKEADFLRLV